MSLSTSHGSDSSYTTAQLLRNAATLDRPRLFTHTSIDDDGEMGRPRSHSMPNSSSRNVRTIERNRHLARRNRPRGARALSDRPPTQPQSTIQDVAESEEEGKVLL